MAEDGLPDIAGSAREKAAPAMAKAGAVSAARAKHRLFYGYVIVAASIFIAMLAFADENLLGAAKLGVLLGSVAAALLGLGWGVGYVRRARTQTDCGLRDDTARTTAPGQENAEDPGVRGLER